MEVSLERALLLRTLLLAHKIKRIIGLDPGLQSLFRTPISTLTVMISESLIGRPIGQGALCVVLLSASNCFMTVSG